jgi:hypothetical protein
MATENLKVFIQELHLVAAKSGGFISDPAYYVKVKIAYEEHKTKT